MAFLAQDNVKLNCCDDSWLKLKSAFLSYFERDKVKAL